jgi:hypothetical protein
MFRAAATHLIEIDQIHGDITEGGTAHHEFYIPTSFPPNQCRRPSVSPIPFTISSILSQSSALPVAIKRSYLAASKGKFAELKLLSVVGTTKARQELSQSRVDREWARLLPSGRGVEQFAD